MNFTGTVTVGVFTDSYLRSDVVHRNRNRWSLHTGPLVRGVVVAFAGKQEGLRYFCLARYPPHALWRIFRKKIETL